MRAFAFQVPESTELGLSNNDFVICMAAGELQAIFSVACRREPP